MLLPQVTGHRRQYCISLRCRFGWLREDQLEGASCISDFLHLAEWRRCIFHACTRLVGLLFRPACSASVPARKALTDETLKMRNGAYCPADHSIDAPTARAEKTDLTTTLLV